MTAPAIEKYHIKVHSLLPALFGHDAVTLGSTCYFRKTPSPYLLAHEYRHVWQKRQLAKGGYWKRRTATLRFWFFYLRKLIHVGYKRNSYEVDAVQWGLTHAGLFQSMAAAFKEAT